MLYVVFLCQAAVSRRAALGGCLGGAVSGDIKILAHIVGVVENKSADVGLLRDIEFGFEFADMTDFIVKKSDKDLQILHEISLKTGGKNISEVQILAPIITPRQDIICLEGTLYAF